jgi:macrolide transport system ATP-binding/permease protein
MRAIAKAGAFLKSLFRRRQAEDDLDDELRYHLEQAVEENIRGGMPPEEARFAARRLLGTVSVVKEECRDAWGIGFLQTLARDLRYAVHMFARTPLFTAVALVTLALGIGANATIFTFVENFLLHPLPVRDSARILFLNWGDQDNLSYPNYIDFRDRNRSFSDLAAYRIRTANVSLHPRDNAYALGNEVTGNYFGTLGVKPELGRFFGPAEDGPPGAHPVIVVSDRLWRNRLAADVNVIGSTVRISGYPFTVIGVAPPSFVGTEVILNVDFWAPMSMELQIEPGNDWIHSRNDQNVFALGRLKPGISPAGADADLDRIAAGLAREYPKDIDPRAKVDLSRPGLFGNNLRRPITLIVGVFAAVAGLVLLLACVNLAGMLLARAADRRREVGIRLALGAGRWQLVRQLMTESLLLAVSGGALGYALAIVVCRLISSWQPAFSLPVNTSLHPNETVLGFACVTVLCTVLLFGLAPALQSAGGSLTSSLKNERWSRWNGWTLRDVLVAAQIAISVVLVIGSVLVIRSSQRALSLNLGIKPEGAVAVSFDLTMQGYGDDRVSAFDADLLARASAIPGIGSVGIVNVLPLQQWEENDTISRADRPIPKPYERRSAILYNISPGYFKAAGTRLLAGRDIDDRDRPDVWREANKRLERPSRVAIVNVACARVLFGGENPLGKRIRLAGNPPGADLEVVGLVENGKYEYLAEPPHPVIFRPLEPGGMRFTTLVARSGLPPAQATDLLRRTVLDLNPELTLTSAGNVKDQLALALLPVRIAAIVLGIFGGLAIVLAATGLFALIAYAVSRRTREIGIRMALGARRNQVLSSVLARILLLCSAGALTGALMALGAGKLLSVVLYGVSPRDPATWVVAFLIVAGVALLACWQPALRAIRIDPALTLREE